MALIDTTNTIDSSIYLKNRFPHNKVGSNYYIQNLQEKRNKDWEFRPNLVDIEEELEKQCNYTVEPVKYSPIDVAIRKVKNEKGQDLGGDWADIAFRDLNHPCNLGYRYRFDTEFPDMSMMTEEEKYFNTSVWLCVNKNPVNPGNNCIIRRCNANIVFGGSPSGSVNEITEIHYEPVILENDLKYINMYYNMTTILPQSEWYATMQMNYFTNCIGINDRVIFGGVDLVDRSNNAVFKVKAVVKSTSLKTFAKNDSPEVDNIPLVLVALDKDTISSNDDFHSRLANQPPIYFTRVIKPSYEYYLELTSVYKDGTIKPIITDGGDSNIEDEFNNKDDLNDINNNINGVVIEKVDKDKKGQYQERILLKETEYYQCNLMFNNKDIKESSLKITASLDINKCEGKPEDYFKLEILNDNIFAITNLKRYASKPLIVTCSCIKPDEPDMIISQEYEFTLGGFY